MNKYRWWQNKDGELCFGTEEFRFQYTNKTYDFVGIWKIKSLKTH